MSEHLTESLIGSEVPAWCKVCKKETRHPPRRPRSRGSHAGKAGPCMEHGPKEKPERKPETMPAPLGAKEWAVYWLQSNELRPSELRVTEFVNGPRRANLFREQTARHRHALETVRRELRESAAMMPDKRFAAGGRSSRSSRRVPSAGTCGSSWPPIQVSACATKSAASTRRTSSAAVAVAMITTLDHVTAERWEGVNILVDAMPNTDYKPREEPLTEEQIIERGEAKKNPK